MIRMGRRTDTDHDAGGRGHLLGMGGWIACEAWPLVKEQIA